MSVGYPEKLEKTATVTRSSYQVAGRESKDNARMTQHQFWPAVPGERKKTHDANSELLHHSGGKTQENARVARCVKTIRSAVQRKQTIYKTRARR